MSASLGRFVDGTTNHTVIIRASTDNRVPAGYTLAIYDDHSLVGSCSNIHTCAVNVRDDASRGQITRNYHARVVKGAAPEDRPDGPQALAKAGALEVVFDPGGGPSDEETAGGKNPSQACGPDCVGDPINVASGELYDSVTDLTVNPDVSLNLSRGYGTSHASVDGPLGYGWSAAAMLGVRAEGGGALADATQVKVVQENGTIVRFYRAGDGSYGSPTRNLARFTANQDGTFALARLQTGETFVFDAQGRFVSAANRDG